MNVVPTELVTLRTLRLSRDLSCEEVARGVGQIIGRPLTWRAAYMWEIRGLDSSEKQDALAIYYDVPLSIIREAARNSKRTSGPVLGVGRPRKITSCAISP